MTITKLVLTTTDGEDIDILATLQDVSEGLAERTEDDNAQGWAADLNMVTAALRENVKSACPKCGGETSESGWCESGCDE